MKKRLCLLLTLTLLFCGCTATPQVNTRQVFAMDTFMELTVYGDHPSLLTQAEENLRQWELLFSPTNPQSDLAKLNAAHGQWVTVHEDTLALITLAKTYAQQTDGAFDPTVYPAVTAWGFTASTQQVPCDEDLQGLIPLIDYRQIQIEGNRVRLPDKMGIDPGAIAKGYAADRLKELYRQAGASGILSLGGNVLTVGSKPNGSPFSVAVRDPADATATLGTLSLNGGMAAVTSGDYQRYFEQDGVRYHHILDPKTAAPARTDLTSVTVVTDCAAAADAYATALFVAGSDQALTLTAQLGMQAVLVTRDRQIIYTDGLTFTPATDRYSVTKWVKP